MSRLCRQTGSPLSVSAVKHRLTRSSSPGFTPRRTAAVFNRRKRRRFFRCEKQLVGSITLFNLIFIDKRRPLWNRRTIRRKDKSRNHPANPVGEPNLHLHTLTSAPVQTELKPILGRDAGPFFTFSHFGQRRTCTDTPRNGSGTFASC